MTDKVYPPSKPNPPPTKTAQLYNQTRPRPVYRPKQTRSSCSGRKCCWLTFLYILITLLIIILLAAIAASIFYVLYHPKPPIFHVISVKTNRFNVTQPDPSGFGHLNSRFDLTLSAKNPNTKKITFVYSPMDVDMSTSGVNAGNATLPAFTHVAGNISVLHATVASDATNDLDSDSVSQLRSDLKKKSGFPVTFVVNTQIEVHIGSKIKSKKVKVRVVCDGIKGGLPPNNVIVSSSTKCKVDLRFKIWKFTF